MGRRRHWINRQFFFFSPPLFWEIEEGRREERRKMGRWHAPLGLAPIKGPLSFRHNATKSNFFTVFLFSLIRRNNPSPVWFLPLNASNSYETNVQSFAVWPNWIQSWWRRFLFNSLIYTNLIHFSIGLQPPAGNWLSNLVPTDEVWEFAPLFFHAHVKLLYLTVNNFSPFSWLLSLEENTSLFTMKSYLF